MRSIRNTEFKISKHLRWEFSWKWWLDIQWFSGHKFLNLQVIKMSCLERFLTQCFVPSNSKGYWTYDFHICKEAVDNALVNSVLLFKKYNRQVPKNNRGFAITTMGPRLSVSHICWIRLKVVEYAGHSISCVFPISSIFISMSSCNRFAVIIYKKKGIDNSCNVSYHMKYRNILCISSDCQNIFLDDSQVRMSPYTYFALYHLSIWFLLWFFLCKTWISFKKFLHSIPQQVGYHNLDWIGTGYWIGFDFNYIASIFMFSISSSWNRTVCPTHWSTCKKETLMILITVCLVLHPLSCCLKKLVRV